MNTVPRPCPVCTHAAKRTLFRQNFGTLSQGSLLSGFDLAVCAACGAGYADGIPGQAEFDRYYAGMSKYEYTAQAGVPTESDRRRFQEVADLVAPHLSATGRLLDIGCATGGLLAEFKRRGFPNLEGVDPSPACARLTTQLHGIPARALTIAMLDQLGAPADAAFLTGVLEHVRDVDGSLDRVKGCLGENGLLYLEVPDATRYDHHFSAPFQLLSMEHVNYFSPVSLENLLARHGFRAVFIRRLIRYLSPQAVEPAIGALFRRETPPGPDAGPIHHDDETGPALERYLHQSRTLEQQIQQRIAALARAGRPLAVWGAGTHTLRLLETSDLSRANIVAFIDSNVHYQGKTLAGHPVVAPSEFRDETAEILISSQPAEAEIFRTITTELRWPNAVHRLYAGQADQ